MVESVWGIKIVCTFKDWARKFNSNTLNNFQWLYYIPIIL